MKPTATAMRMNGSLCPEPHHQLNDRTHPGHVAAGGNDRVGFGTEPRLSKRNPI